MGASDLRNILMAPAAAVRSFCVLWMKFKKDISVPDNKNLLVGNSSKDDAAVCDLENGVVNFTTDFLCR
jgi:selenophosphate synthase